MQNCFHLNQYARARSEIPHRILRRVGSLSEPIILGLVNLFGD